MSFHDIMRIKKLHDDYIYKYNELLLKPSNVIPMSQSDNKSPEMSSRKGTKKGTSTSTTWKVIIDYLLISIAFLFTFIFCYADGNDAKI